ncbi:J domain-containing protein required for chloroplast accumulation response 1 [Humulus lupulus]|uniref:J domain-containing protein required for chloroplast accumulation response 1 n=1 Tax=Humulus lupulus TaxID=3486 RepID=UPI002B4117F6|nr:J domain-containing protein required for chloroplast accumulation response 1 [Humulus lupulus]
MERFSQKEGILIGYSVRRSSLNSGSSPKTSFRNSDVDFHDVFGGPPRRFSMPEVPHSFSDANESRGKDELWTGSGEKPVFGDEGMNRRRYHSSDFFDDIFGGDASATSTPKKQGREYPFPSSPGSRVLSPLPPRAEPFGSSSLSQFSLPPNMIKTVELPTFGSPARSLLKLNDDASNEISDFYSPGASLPRSSKEAIQGTEGSRNDVWSSYNQGSSSQEILLSSEVSSNLAGSDQIDKGINLKKDPETSEKSSTSGHFHFSIYKWAGKGVPLDIPLRGRRSSRLREMTKSDEPPPGTDEGVNQSAKTPLSDSSSNSHITLNVQSNKFENNKQENESTQDEITPEKIKRNKVDDVVIHPVPQRIMGYVPEKSGKGISASKEEAHQPEMKPINSLLFDNGFERDASNVKIAKMDDQMKENKAKSTKASSSVVGNSKTAKKQERIDISQISSEVDGASFRGSPKKSKESYGRNKVKGRVKDFVKMFNQETPSKPKDGLSFRSQSCKWNNKFNLEVETSINTAVTDEKLKMHESSGDLKQSTKAYASTPGSPNPTTTTGSFPDNINVKVEEEADESFHENFQVKELPQIGNENPETGPHNQEMQDLDTKIRQWTRGKEGNIRSLLSTLQYVLWAESGWKPVPLVDIIEGNAVKRSYQKALLCLHPDKLQQKGAASHQKYIAEKVFDILQEAWNYFNSLGSV